MLELYNRSNIGSDCVPQLIELSELVDRYVRRSKGQSKGHFTSMQDTAIEPSSSTLDNDV